MSKKFKRVVIIGPSGGGKTKVGHDILRDILGFITFVTCTTRDMRVGEIQDISYHFLTQEEFKNIEKVEFTEYPKDSGKFYGLSVKEVEEKATLGDCYCIMDINGALALKEKFPDTKIIFIYSPIEILEQRMRDRGDEESKIQGRLLNITKSKEMENSKYADLVVENINFDDTKKQIIDYISTL